MSRSVIRNSEKAGLAPGTIVHVGERKSEKVLIQLTSFDRENLRESEPDSVTGLPEPLDPPAVNWLNVCGLHETETIEKTGALFSLHPLILEDIVHTGQRPKIEEYDDLLFIVAKSLRYSQEQEFSADQISFVLGPNLVVSFQESNDRLFAGVRGRVLKGNKRIRSLGSSYLCYALLDAIVDNYFLVIERIREEIEDVEESLFENPGEDTLQTLHRLYGEIIFLRKNIWPLQGVINKLARGDFPQVEDETCVFFRDVYDHITQILENIQTFRDIVTGLLDMYMSIVSNRMNEVMKVLTVIATIFIPITFLAGIYGMNFEFMPELQWRWAYPALWIVFLALIFSMLLYFKRKKWW